MFASDWRAVIPGNPCGLYLPLVASCIIQARHDHAHLGGCPGFGVHYKDQRVMKSARRDYRVSPTNWLTSPF